MIFTWGMSAKLCDRLLTYFSAGDDSAKERRIAKHARQVIWEQCAHEFTAHLRELELIRRGNVSTAVAVWTATAAASFCLTTDEAPHFHVATRLPRDSRALVGAGPKEPPVAGGDRPPEPCLPAARLLA